MIMCLSASGQMQRFGSTCTMLLLGAEYGQPTTPRYRFSVPPTPTAGPVGHGGMPCSSSISQEVACLSSSPNCHEMKLLSMPASPLCPCFFFCTPLPPRLPFSLQGAFLQTLLHL